ncbi:MAG: alpha/beta superfamily hydrolase [Ilumatobacter sp.]|jgi:alpha/beta superfamily hydrolase
MLPNLPLIATGYSFGAAIVSQLDDVRIRTKVLVAPPLAAMPTIRGMDVPTLVLTPAHDQFSAPDATEAIISEWPQTTHEIIASADHFLNGRTELVAKRALIFIIHTLFEEGVLTP